ncbi:xanthosine triphosphate pyrophosphatase [Fructobacillus ficulneus]|uniref:Xanthosine triphosphate pyrophosphatase n=2 Tax=Fructobacillus ficulneus TaxID=157463 RepID=A0A0K8MIV9_9LACO|nr:xanthosine triphosphate pyrophosphatase [Fructobacillus ficulneus]
MEFIFASNNSAKTAEMTILAEKMGHRVINYRDVLGRELKFPAETTDSQVENARIKANFVHQYLPDCWVLADDTGLYLQAFPNRFGVTSSREFKDLGVLGTEAEIAYIQSLYHSEEDRSAYLLAVLALCTPAGQMFLAEGRGGVRIAEEAHSGPYIGGLDDIMEAENGKTLSEMSLDEVVAYHDRSRALKNIIEQIQL